MTETITGKEFLALLIRRSRRILITALVCALLLGGLQGVRLLRRGTTDDFSSQNTASIIWERKEALAKDKVDAWENYIKTAPLMQIDPSHTSITTVLMDITPVSGDRMSADDGALLSDANVCVAWLNGCDFRSLTAGSSFSQTDSAYLTEVFDVAPLSDRVLCLIVLGASAQQSEELASVLYQGLKAQFSGSDRAQPIVGEILSTTTQTEADIGILEKQEAAYTAFYDAQDALAELVTQGEPEPFSEVSGVSGGAVMKSCVKFAVLGLLLGLVLSCAVVFVQGVFSGRVETPAQLAAAGGAPYFGTLNVPARASGRISAALSGETLWADTTAAAAYLAERIAALPGAETGVLLLSSAPDAADALSALVAALQKKNCPVFVAANAASDPAAFALLKRSGVVLLAERRGDARAEQLRAEQSLLSTLSRKVDGAFFL